MLSSFDHNYYSFFKAVFRDSPYEYGLTCISQLEKVHKSSVNMSVLPCFRAPALKYSRYSRKAFATIPIGVHGSVHNTADPHSLTQTPFIGVTVL